MCKAVKNTLLVKINIENNGCEELREMFTQAR
jgi:hypothetical protein